MTLRPLRLAPFLLLPFLLLALPALGREGGRGGADGLRRCRRAPAGSPAESWVWRQICAGATAELDKGTGVSDASRKLSPTFMTALFFDPQLKALIPHSGVHIAGGEIDFPLNLANAAPGYELSLERMRFAGDVDLHGLSTAENISFANSRFLGSVDLDGGSFAGNLSLAGAIVAGQLHLLRTTIGGSAEFDGIAVGKGLNLERLAIAHNLQLRHAALPGISLARRLDQGRYPAPGQRHRRLGLAGESSRSAATCSWSAAASRAPICKGRPSAAISR